MANTVNKQSTASSDGEKTSIKKSYVAGETQLNDKATAEFIQQADLQEKRELQGAQYQGQINWLGSSFTGQDIKVVAHLYDDARSEVNTQKAKLEKEKAYLDVLSIRADALSSNGVFDQILATANTFDKRKEAFLGVLGPASTPEEERANKYLLGLVLYNADINFFLGLTRIREALKTLVTHSRKESEILAKRIEDINNLDSSGASTITLGTLQTLSIQSVREKFAVRALGHAYAKAYTRGTRTLAGSMIFTLFEEHPLSKLINAMGLSDRWKSPEIARLLPDQIPPIDITIIFANEYGVISQQKLYGVEFVNDSTTYSIENLLSEQILQFTCRDIDILTSNGKKKLNDAQMFGEGELPFTASQLYNDNDYQEYLETLGLRRRLSNR